MTKQALKFNKNRISKTSAIIKKSQRKKTKIQIEQLDKQNVSLLDLNHVAKKEKSHTLKAKTLFKDHKKDQEINEKSNKQTKQLNESMLRQLEMISGLSF